MAEKVKYNGKVALKKGAKEGTATAAIAILLKVDAALLMAPEPMAVLVSAAGDAAVQGAVLGLGVGIVRWWRNRRKIKKLEKEQNG